MASYRKRGKSSYRITVSQGYDNNGKKLIKSKTITLAENLTEKQIEKELTIQMDKFEKEVQTGTYLDGSITLHEFAEKWLKDYGEAHLRPKTLGNYRYLLQRILPALGHKKLDSIQPTHLMEFYRNIAEDGIRLDYKYCLKSNIVSEIPDLKKRVSAIGVNSTTIRNLIKGGNTTKEVAEKISTSLSIPVTKVFDIVGKDKKLSQKSISHHHKLITAIFAAAVQWQLIMSNPTERVKPPKVTKKEARYYDVSEVSRMFAVLDNEPIKYKTMIHIVLFCGLRLGELVDLEWMDIDFENETIAVSKQLQYLSEYGVYEMKNTKTESGNRTISMPSMLTELLKEYKTWQDEEKNKYGNRWITSNKLFTRDNGEPIFPQTPSSWFSKFIKKNNLPPLTFHQLRHTNASLLIGQGVDVATVSKRLGHADKSVTLRTYTHVLKQNDRAAVEKLDNLFNKEEKSEE